MFQISQNFEHDSVLEQSDPNLALAPRLVLDKESSVLHTRSKFVSQKTYQKNYLEVSKCHGSLFPSMLRALFSQ